MQTHLEQEVEKLGCSVRTEPYGKYKMVTYWKNLSVNKQYSISKKRLAVGGKSEP